jgi:hypothetical protein
MREQEQHETSRQCPPAARLLFLVCQPQAGAGRETAVKPLYYEMRTQEPERLKRV